jgi:peptidoglycan hydrolase-like protein with peptidoglycan-binding domain
VDNVLVRKWQHHLRDEGIYDGAIDGVYGSQMEQAMTLCALRPACLDFD